VGNLKYRFQPLCTSKSVRSYSHYTAQETPLPDFQQK